VPINPCIAPASASPSASRRGSQLPSVYSTGPLCSLYSSNFSYLVRLRALWFFCASQHIFVCNTLALHGNCLVLLSGCCSLD
jgi:hypothetical protein